MTGLCGDSRLTHGDLTVNIRREGKWKWKWKGSKDLNRMHGAGEIPRLHATRRREG